MEFAMKPASPVRRTLGRLWEADRPLTAVGLVMLGALVASVIGIIVDPRTITGMPAWLKPAKFAASTAIYSVTLAWIFTYLPDWPRLRRIVGRATAAIFALEVGIIDTQAWRGTTSHFNVGTPLDATLFAIMGVAIVIQVVLSISVAVALWRQRFADRALGLALRLGVTIAIIGAATGGLMTRPTDNQIAEARATHRISVSGAHTVGAPDGGSGLPATGWSLEHGDLRVAHFVGLHAMQGLPLMAGLLASLGVAARRRERLVLVFAASYLALFLILLMQALQGESIVQPSGTTLTIMSVWIASTIVGASVAGVRRIDRSVPLTAFWGTR
jgi:hypothetical protein